jgi:hypothetical protein
MERILKNYILGIIIVSIIASPSIMMSQKAFGTPKNPVNLPQGIWTLYAGGQKGFLNITLVEPGHLVEGTLTAVGQYDGRPALTSRIFGF